VIRKDVARLKTVLKEKIIGIEYAVGADSKPKAGGAKPTKTRSKR
jgi:hypothetical protein